MAHLNRIAPQRCKLLPELSLLGSQEPFNKKDTLVPYEGNSVPLGYLVEALGLGLGMRRAFFTRFKVRGLDSKSKEIESQWALRVYRVVAQKLEDTNKGPKILQSSLQGPPKSHP